MIRMANFFLSEDGSATAPVGDLSEPRGLLFFAIPAKVIPEAISRCRRLLKAWLEVSTVPTSTGPLCRLN